MDETIQDATRRLCLTTGHTRAAVADFFAFLPHWWSDAAKIQAVEMCIRTGIHTAALMTVMDAYQ